MSKIQQRRQPCVIAGDMNIDLLKYSTHTTTKSYINNLISNNFLPVVVMPTCITDKSATLIDHIYYSEGSYKNSNYIVKTGNIWCDISDHLTNYILITNNEDNREKNQNDQLPLIRLFSAKNIQKFKNQLSLVDWSVVHNCSDVNIAYKTFHEILNKCYEDSFPYVRLSRKRAKDSKWFTAGLKCSSHYKNRLYRKWLKSRSAEDEQHYKSYLKVYKQVLKRAETLYYKEHFDTRYFTRVNSVKQLWTNINHLLITNTKLRTQIQKLTVNNKVITNPRDIGNSLNNYFCSVVESLAASLKTHNLDDFSKYCPLTSK